MKKNQALGTGYGALAPLRKQSRIGAYLGAMLLCSGIVLSATPLPAASAPDYAAPGELAGVTREMRTAGFWIARHPYPDKLILTPTEVAKFNARTRAEGLIVDLTAWPVNYYGAKLKAEIRKIVDDFKSRSLYQENGMPADDAFYSRLKDGLGLGTIPATVAVRYGFIAVPANERLLPTNEPLNAKAGDTDFDELQNSGLDVGTAVVILHSTGDGRWLFVKDAAATGWVEAAKVVLVTREEFVSHLRRQDIVVAVGPKVDIFLDRELTDYFTSVKMGARFVLKNVAGRVVEVLIPQRQVDGVTQFRPGFIAREDVNVGYLPYTPRTVLRQAFKLLNAPYGWGDMYGEQDCSRFIQMVFATVGVEMPRNSPEQGKVGEALGEFAETAPVVDKQVLVVSKAVGALTLLRLKGHIMLYLGQYHDRLFAIHDAWSYREAVRGGEERTRVIGRVAVTDLTLGEGTAKGSFLKRLLSVRAIIPGTLH